MFLPEAAGGACRMRGSKVLQPGRGAVWKGRGHHGERPQVLLQQQPLQGWAPRSFPHPRRGGGGGSGASRPAWQPWGRRDTGGTGRASPVEKPPRWKSHLVSHQGLGSCKASLSVPVPGALEGGDGISPRLCLSSSSSHTHRDHAGLLKYHLLQWSLPG